MKTKIAALSLLLVGCQNQVSTTEKPVVTTPVETEKKAVTLVVDYETPKGVTPYNVTFNLEGDVIKSFTSEGNEKHKTSWDYQKATEEVIKDLIIDKSLEDISIPARINGSSLTSPAWEKAIKELKQS